LNNYPGHPTCDVPWDCSGSAPSFPIGTLEIAAMYYVNKTTYQLYIAPGPDDWTDPWYEDVTPDFDMQCNATLLAGVDVSGYHPLYFSGLIEKDF